MVIQTTGTSHTVLAASLSAMLVTFPAGETSAAGGDFAERRHALVIGNANYHNQPLRNPVNDARAMSAALTARGFEVMLVENATRRSMQNAIIEFGERLANGGAAVFYYAGHGLQVRGTNYLVPTDVNIRSEASVRFEAINLKAVLEEMSLPRPQRTNIVILDACRNTPFASRHGEAAAGLALVDAPTDFLIAYATAPGRVAIDGDADHGLYTSEIIKAMALPDLDVEDMFKRVRTAVSQRSGQKQVPWEASSLVRDFSFQRPEPRLEAESGAVASLPPNATHGGPKDDARIDMAEAHFWDSVRHSNFAEDYLAYLEAFPGGTFAPLAQVRAVRYEREAKRKTESGPEVAYIQAPYETIADASPYPSRSPYASKAETPCSGNEATATAKAKDSNCWFEVKNDDVAVGYAYGRLIRDPAESSGAAAFGKTGIQPAETDTVAHEVNEIEREYIAIEDTSIREAPSIDAPEIAGMKVGQRLRVTGKVKGSDWFRIETAGYIDGRLIRKLELTAPATPPAPPAAATTISEIVKSEGTYVTLTYANIRERPTALARAIERIEAGTPLIAAGKVKNANWYYVRTYSGVVGYVFGELIEETAVP